MAERQRGEAGHWTYSYPRHAAILHAYRTETAEIEALEAIECGALASEGLL